MFRWANSVPGTTGLGGCDRGRPWCDVWGWPGWGERCADVADVEVDADPIEGPIELELVFLEDELLVPAPFA